MGLFTDGFKLLKKASEPLYKTPKSIQETIEIMAVAENGIFEVSRNKYSKCYRFQDINYTTATEDEQIGIFERYCRFLNSLDCNYKITINNKNKNMEELRDKVLIAERNDGFNNYRRIYNEIIEEKIIEGRQGIEQERYLTITINIFPVNASNVLFAPFVNGFVISYFIAVPFCKIQYLSNFKQAGSFVTCFISCCSIV